MAVFLKGENWYIDYYVGPRRKREKIGPSKELAVKVLKKRQVEVAEGRFLDIKKTQKIRFEDFADEYFAVHLQPNCENWAKSEFYTIRRLKAFFAGKYLTDITPRMVEEFKLVRMKEAKPKTVNNGLSCLRSIFNKAITWGRFDGRNPVKEVKFAKVDNKRLRYLEKEEIPILLSNCAVHLRPIVIVALYTGMRKSEILHLKWQDIDFKRDLIQLLKTKNNKPRHIPMNEIVKTTFVAVRKDPDSPYVFVNRFGQPYSDLKRVFTTALKKSGITDFRFHDLRHTFASQLVMSGVDLNTVRELLGHSSLQMTLRYSHLSPDHKKRAVDVLGQRLDTGWTPDMLEEKLTIAKSDSYDKIKTGS